METCPWCGSSAHRSRIRWYDRPRRALFGKHPYRCSNCRHRFWRNDYDWPVEQELSGEWEEEGFEDDADADEDFEDGPGHDLADRGEPLSDEQPHRPTRANAVHGRQSSR